jgi:hypothetical protein
MGEVIQFPDEAGYARRGRYVDASSAPATVIILPVVRVERASDAPTKGEKSSAGKSAGRRRRRATR